VRCRRCEGDSCSGGWYTNARDIQWRVVLSIMLVCLAQMVEAVLAQLLAGNFYR
jgi:hypothetical protein